MTIEQRNAIASRLRLARERAGLSQGQVAKLVAMHRPSVSEIEAGRRSVTAEELTKFAKINDGQSPSVLRRISGGASDGLLFGLVCGLVKIPLSQSPGG